MDQMTPVQLRVTCKHLRHKMMYVDERQREIGRVDDQSDTRVFWCAKTADSLGPDAEAVTPKVCTSARGCYCPGE